MKFPQEYIGIQSFQSVQPAAQALYSEVDAKQPMVLVKRRVRVLPWWYLAGLGCLTCTDVRLPGASRPLATVTTLTCVG
jgi:hypothetical protein